MIAKLKVTIVVRCTHVNYVANVMQKPICPEEAESGPRRADPRSRGEMQGLRGRSTMESEEVDEVEIEAHATGTIMEYGRVVSEGVRGWV